MEWNDVFNFAEDSRCFGEGNVGGCSWCLGDHGLGRGEDVLFGLRVGLLNAGVGSVFPIGV